MMEGRDLLGSLHIRVNVIGMWGRSGLRGGNQGSVECVEQAHRGTGAAG